MADKTKNYCERLVPGGEDCLNQIGKGYCSFTQGEDICAGRVGAIGANVEKGKEAAIEYESHEKVFNCIKNTLLQKRQNFIF